MERTGAEVLTEPLSVSHVPVESVNAVWTEILPMIERGLSRGQGDDTTSDLMLAAIHRGDMQMWVVHEDTEIIAGIVLSGFKNPAVTKLFIELIAGRDMDSWAGLVEGLLMDLKELIGATCIEASCRLGLAKRLADRGWRKKAIVMELK